MQNIKLFEEFNQSSFDTFRKIAYNQTKDDRRFQLSYFGAFVSTVWMKAGLYKTKEIPKELIEACKDVLIEVYFDNIEPEWDEDEIPDEDENKSMYYWWENLAPDNFEVKIDHHSPYQDKTLPYLVMKKECMPPHGLFINK